METAPSGLAGGGLRASEKIGEVEPLGAIAKIAPVERVTLHQQNAQHIAPLPVGDLASLAKPPQLLQQDIFGGVSL